MSDNLDMRFIGYMFLIVLCFFTFIGLVQFSILWKLPYVAALCVFPLACCFWLAHKAVFGQIEGEKQK